MNNEIIPSFKKSLFDSSIDIGVDLLDVSIDMITENEVIKEIPVVGEIVKLSKSVIAIRERHLIKKLVVFIESINNGHIKKEVLEEHKKMLEENPKKLYKELEYILVLIDRQLEMEKTMILAEFYKSYISRRIGWGDFLYLSELLEKFPMRANGVLKTAYEEGHAYSYNSGIVFSLESIGLIGCFSVMSNEKIVSTETGKKIPVMLKGYGKLFYECGLKDLMEQHIIDEWF